MEKVERKGDIVIESEQGFIIDSFDLRIGKFTDLIYASLSGEYLDQTFCLQFIDPYSGTMFNSLQTEKLITELEELEIACRSVENKEYIRSIIAFLRMYGEVHTFVRFYGD